MSGCCRIVNEERQASEITAGKTVVVIERTQRERERDSSYWDDTLAKVINHAMELEEMLFRFVLCQTVRLRLLCYRRKLAAQRRTLARD